MFAIKQLQKVLTLGKVTNLEDVNALHLAEREGTGG